MLKSLRLSNFQCFRDFELKLGRVTTICGDNDKGKSAITRALRFVALNEWDGKKDDMVTWGEENCEVILETEKNIISRAKGKQGNFYRIGEQEYPSFGTKVPLSILKDINLTPNNFQNQDDLPFWLNLSSGDAAAQLNEIFNLEAIDKAHISLATELREARSISNVSETRLKDAEEKKKKLEWVEEADEKLKGIESLIPLLEEREEEITKVENVLKHLNRALDLQKFAGKFIELGSRVINTNKQIYEKEKEIVEVKHQLTSIEDLKEKEERLCSLKKKLSEKEKKLKTLMKVCPLCHQNVPT